jgi:tRNA modification GTPase
MRLAEPGEFSRRALENGKLDLLQVEGLGDLLAAETDAQLAQAQRQMAGALSEKVRQWQDRLTALRAHVEAALDFADEGDVVAQADQGVRAALAALSTELTRELQKAHQGQRIRDGYSVVIVGPPNVGKSTLMNALAARDVAIVTDRPGTTRDLLEWSCVIQGLPVVMVDTAGLRETGDAIEAEGIRRARARAAQADLVLLLASVDTEPLPSLPLTAAPIIRVMTKGDLPGAEDPDALVVCAQTGDGLAALRAAIGDHLAHAAGGEPALVSRERQRLALAEAVAALERAQERREDELVAEELRLAARHLGRLVGHVDVETVLDRLFEGFCIGK